MSVISTIPVHNIAVSVREEGEEEEEGDETGELSSDDDVSEEGSDSDDGDEGDDLTLSLAAMEEAVFDDVMVTLNEIAGTFKIYEYLQERQLAGEELSEDEFQKLQSKRILLAEQMQNIYLNACLLYTSPSPRDLSTSRMPSSA